MLKFVSPTGHESDLFQWDYGTDLAKELLTAIQICGASSGINRVDGEGFKVYWAGGILRVDIMKSELRD